jgi:hypothetical protein|tara:strand:- start:193 stop:486 length:294 start_codon:yes stop_codon:yes gene_type:complete
MICLAVVLFNLTALPLNDKDFKVLDRAQTVCAAREGCVTKFQKRGQGTYRVSCGEKRSFDRKEFDKAELAVIMEELSVYDEATQKEMLRKIGYEGDE